MDYKKDARYQEHHFRPELPIFYRLLAGAPRRDPGLDDCVAEEAYGPVDGEENEKSYEDIIESLHKI
jgi:hypothetical protein